MGGRMLTNGNNFPMITHFVPKCGRLPSPSSLWREDKLQSGIQVRRLGPHMHPPIDSGSKTWVELKNNFFDSKNNITFWVHLQLTNTLYFLLVGGGMPLEATQR